MKMDMWVALMALVLPYLVPPEQFQKWMLRPVFALHERGRQKKRAEKHGVRSSIVAFVQVESALWLDPSASNSVVRSIM